MPLSAIELGDDLYNRANAQNEIDIEDIEQARKDFWRSIAAGIIDHFKTHGVIPGTGLVAPNGAVTGSTTIQ